MVDVLDGPLGSYKKRGSDPHVSELQARLRERKKLGLTHDLSDSDVIEDHDDGDSEDDVLNQYRMESNSHHKRTDRPGSAKRRSPISSGGFDSGISLGDTLRPGQGNRFMKSSRNTASQKKTEMPALTSPKQSDRHSPLDSMSYEQKEAIIMNRKTPTKEMQRQSPVDHNKPWQPPSYRKVSLPTEEEGGDTTSGILRGRKTPQDPLLESISETPSPRQRKQSPGADRRMPSLDRKSPGMERKSPGLERKSPGLDRRSPSSDRRSPGTERKLRESPKPLNLDDPLMSGVSAAPRPKLKTDVFGSTSTMDAALDEEPTPKPRKSRFGHKSPSETDRFSGRKTPTEKDRLSGRKTPTEKDRFSGRKTPTGKTTPTFGRKPLSENLEKEKPKDTTEKRAEPSLMDFLTGDISQKDKQTKGKSKLFDDDEEEEKEKKQKVKETRRNRYEAQKEPEPDSFEALLAKKSYNKGKKTVKDDSSVCEELEFEPEEKKAAELEAKQNQSLRSYSKQRSDKQEAEDAIDLVAGQQSQSIKPIQRPGSAKKTTGKIVKPKPRHSLPGTPTPSVTLSETQFNDTKSLREAIFNEWKKERTKTLVQKKTEEAKKKEEAEKQKKKEVEDKRLENEAAFRTWKEQKEPLIKDKVKEKHKEEKKKKEEQEEAERKKKDAEKEFKKWKEMSDEKLKEKAREKKRAERQKELDEKEKKRLKEKDNQSALKVWQAKKEEVIKHQHHEEKEKMKKTKKHEEELKREQEEEARRKYEKWLQRKDKQKVAEKKMKYSSVESLDEKPAWSPASRTIPYGR